ncbi:MAG: arginase family protein [Acidobacteriota bacterium]
MKSNSARVLGFPLTTRAEFRGMAEAPDHLRRHGLSTWVEAEGLEDRGNVAPASVAADGETLGRFLGQTSEAVEGALADGGFLLGLGGECTASIGAISAAQRLHPDLRLLWLDAHGDFNTAATTPSGFWGGMCLAHIAGLPIPGVSFGADGVLDGERVVLVGARDLDPGEADNVSAVGGHLLHFDQPGPLLDQVRHAVSGAPLWIHLDVDVLDPSVVSSVHFPTPGGPDIDQVVSLLVAVSQDSPVVALEVTAFSSETDQDGQAARTVLKIIDRLMPAMSGRPSSLSQSPAEPA